MRCSIPRHGNLLSKIRPDQGLIASGQWSGLLKTLHLLNSFHGRCDTERPDPAPYTDLGWTIEQAPVAKGQTVQMVVFNNSFGDLELDLQAFGFAPTIITPLDTVVLEWVAEAGTFFLPDNGLLVVSSEDICTH